MGLSQIDTPQPHKENHEKAHHNSQSSPPEIPVKPSSDRGRPISQHRDRFESSPRRQFESSLGSDTGTSTRESECSEEHAPTSPVAMKANLYDSLAAELRAKLSGNGPPLLLPPRDYDTVHRSKGNLTAIELRRLIILNISIKLSPHFI